MSTTFTIEGIPADYDGPTNGETYVNLNSRNTVDLMARMDWDYTPDGSALCFDVLQDVNAALASNEAHRDHGVEGREYRARDGQGCRVVEGARPAEWINMRLRHLKTLCENGLAKVGPLAILRWS